MSVIRFTTQSGSEYEITDTPKMTWRRIFKAKASGGIRAESGELVQWPKLRMGRGAILQDTSVVEGFDGHIVYTSDVTSISIVEKLADIELTQEVVHPFGPQKED